MKSDKNKYFYVVSISLLFLLIGIYAGLCLNTRSESKTYNVTNDKKTYDSKVGAKEFHDSYETENNEIDEQKIENKQEEYVLNKDIKNESINSNTSVSKENDNVVKVNYSNNDNLVIEKLEYDLKKVETSDGTCLKTTFINIVDFLFYDGKINGVTFDELSENGKQKVLELANKIDLKIEKKFPGYKETISNKATSAFLRVSEIIKDGAKDLSSFSKEKLGEENYNSIIDAKDELVLYSKNALSFVKDIGTTAFEKTKEKLNSWYQNFKNN